MTHPNDHHYMRYALSLARRGLGSTWPNPSVGCVIVKNDRIISCARTEDGGRPHAEAIALAVAGQVAKGATIYVTLEPCAHEGKTPPCVEAIIKAAPARVVVGVADMNPEVNGKGIAALALTGINVNVGVLEEECRAHHQSFFLRFSERRPFVTLKTACSLDGKVALATGASQWITGELARRHVHHLRAQHDAVLVGIGTVRSDNPMLNARVDGIVHKTVRIVLDSNLEIPLECQLVKSAQDYPLWIFYEEAPVDKISALEKAGIRLFLQKDKTVRPLLETLAGQGITRLLVEGGRHVHTAFLKEGYGDEIHIYRAPVVLGDDAYDAFLDFGHKDLNKIKGFVQKETRLLGKDSLEIYARKG